jgi:hypothetical protein
MYTPVALFIIIHVYFERVHCLYIIMYKLESNNDAARRRPI